MDLSLLVQFMLYHRHPRSFSHDSLDSSSSGSLLPSIVHPLSIPVNDIEPRHPKGGRAKSQRRSDSWDNMDEATLPSTLRRELGAARPISRTDSTQSGTRGGQSTLTSLLVIAGASKAVNALSTSYIVRDVSIQVFDLTVVERGRDYKNTQLDTIHCRTLRLHISCAIRYGRLLFIPC